MWGGEGTVGKLSFETMLMFLGHKDTIYHNISMLILYLKQHISTLDGGIYSIVAKRYTDIQSRKWGHPLNFFYVPISSLSAYDERAVNHGRIFLS